MSTCGDHATRVVLLLLFHLLLAHLLRLRPLAWYYCFLSTCGDSGHLRGITITFPLITCPLVETQATCVVLLFLVHLRSLRPLAWYYCYLPTCRDSGHLRGITVSCPLAETQATCVVLLFLVHLRRLRPLAWYYCYLPLSVNSITFHIHLRKPCHLRGITITFPLITCPLAETQATYVVLLLLVQLR